MDEQTQMQNRIREKNEVKQQMAEREEKTPPKKPATISDAPDIWTLDEKLKHIKSPELRAALRRLGGPVGEDEGTKN